MPNSIFDPPDIASQRDWISDVLRATIKTEITHESMVDHAQRVRVIPKGLSPMDGLFSWDVTPYLEEIADCLSETSPVQEVVLMKGSRVGATVGIGENWILYTIDVAPAPMLYVGQDKESAEEVMKTRVGPMINDSGLAHKIFAPQSSATTRATGDTNKLKEFAGGRLRAIGPSVGAKLRGTGYSKLFLDEIDAWQNEVGTAGGKKKAEGSTLSLILRRSDEYEETRKIFYASTPLVKSSSLIEPLFEAGDQRRFFVPCKHCGHMQYLKWEGIKYEVDETGRLVESSVHYECEECKGHWKNDDKVNFMKTKRQGGKAEWRPTAQPRRRGLRSYHLPSFYSPVGFRSWESIVQEWLDVGDDITKRQTIINTVFGETWEERGSVPEYWKVMARKEPRREDEGSVHYYDPTKFPDRSLIITVGADTQDNRIEAEITAWGRNWESWSLGYRVFMGDTSDLGSTAWSGFREFIDSGHDGHPIAMALIDSKGHRTQEVYTFCESYLEDRGQVLPCSGEPIQNADRKLYTLREVTGYAVKRADLQVSQFKSQIYSYLNRSIPEDGGLIPIGYCHFPVEYEEKYFRGLMSEERVTVRKPGQRPHVEWKPIKGRPRNEPLDCRVYSMSALYIFRHFVWQTYFREFDEELPWTMFWDWCEENIAS